MTFDLFSILFLVLTAILYVYMIAVMKKNDVCGTNKIKAEQNLTEMLH